GPAGGQGFGWKALSPCDSGHYNPTLSPKPLQLHPRHPCKYDTELREGGKWRMGIWRNGRLPLGTSQYSESRDRMPVGLSSRDQSHEFQRRQEQSDTKGTSMASASGCELTLHTGTKPTSAPLETRRAIEETVSSSPAGSFPNYKTVQQKQAKEEEMDQRFHGGTFPFNMANKEQVSAVT
ncbi:hypothetical protein JZ751_012761, partial [Albula glossodonta]